MTEIDRIESLIKNADIYEIVEFLKFDSQIFISYLRTLSPNSSSIEVCLGESILFCSGMNTLYMPLAKINSAAGNVFLFDQEKYLSLEELLIMLKSLAPFL